MFPVTVRVSCCVCDHPPLSGFRQFRRRQPQRLPPSIPHSAQSYLFSTRNRFRLFDVPPLSVADAVVVLLAFRWAELENEAKERQRALLGELDGDGGGEDLTGSGSTGEKRGDKREGGIKPRNNTRGAKIGMPTGNTLRKEREGDGEGEGEHRLYTTLGVDDACSMVKRWSSVANDVMSFPGRPGLSETPPSFCLSSHGLWYPSSRMAPDLRFLAAS